MPAPLLYLVRHAEVIIRGDREPPEWPLSPQGLEDAHDLARAPLWSSVALVASSPEKKTRATARPIAEAAGLEVRVEPDLREVDRGATPLVSADEYHALVAAHFAAPDESVSGWEPAGRASARVVACIERIASESDGPACIVSHGLVLSHYLAHLRGLDSPSVEEWRAIALPAVAVVDLESREVRSPFASLMEFMGRAE
ncbi:MAG TPA: histidine phosphatase family protein [Gaiellaceae bacterium]